VRGGSHPMRHRRGTSCTTHGNAPKKGVVSVIGGESFC
jgi:hypothetical protein